MSYSGVQQHFEREAFDYYDRNYNAPRTRHERALALRRELCLELLEGTQGRMLDLGCGPGALAVPLAHQGHTVVAMDLSPKMVQTARRLIGEDERHGFVVANATSLPFASSSFDVVVSTGVLEYVPGIDAALSEIHRILVPGGTLVATVSLPRRLERAVTRAFGRVLTRLKNGKPSEVSPFHRAYSAEQFDTLLDAARFDVNARRFSCFAPFPLDAIYPPLVTAIDRTLGERLARSAMATGQAKTYIVRATRS